MFYTGNSPVSRRTMLLASAAGTAGFAGVGTASNAVAQGPVRGAGRAKSTIVFFLCGGSSHIDMWDMKPQAPMEYRGPFQAIGTSTPEIQLCEHLPLLSQQAHHLSLIRSVGASVNTNDHHAGYYYNLTGHVPDRTFLAQGNDRRPYPDDWPYMGSVIAAKRESISRCRTRFRCLTAQVESRIQGRASLLPSLVCSLIRCTFRERMISR